MWQPLVFCKIIFILAPLYEILLFDFGLNEVLNVLVLKSVYCLNKSLNVPFLFELYSIECFGELVKLCCWETLISREAVL